VERFLLNQDRIFSWSELMPTSIFSLFNQNPTTLSLLSKTKQLENKENEVSIYQK
jgi:hypothetical protein